MWQGWQFPWISMPGFLLLCSLGSLQVQAEEVAEKAVPAIAAQADAACDCVYPWRAYPRQPTPEVLALFDAARRLDEPAFARLITTVPDIREYAVDDQNLLEILLWPNRALLVGAGERQVWTNFDPRQAAKIRAAHAATLPVRERMLALALEHGASARDFTFQGRHPPLHLAMAFGSPTMIRLLLQHGADPAQRDSDEFLSAGEFVLDNEYFIRMTFLPLLVEPAARTEMLTILLDAGAGLPFKLLDDFQEKETGKPSERPIADYLLWPSLLSLTEGEQILTTYAALGTRPVFSEEDIALTPLALAARAGNPDGVRWLMARTPRQISTEQTYPLAAGTYDTWLYAAAWAVYPLSDRLGRPDRVDDILNMLIRPDMPWLQANELLDDGRNDLVASRNQETSTTGTTLLHHLVYTHRPDWVARIVKMGAPVDGGENPPLLTAVRQRNLPMLRLLLSLGANPLAGKEQVSSPLYRSVMDRVEGNANSVRLGETGATEAGQVIEAMLGALTPDQKTLLAGEENSLMDIALYQVSAPEGEIVRALLGAGIPWQGLDRSAVLAAMNSPDRGLVGALLDYGVRLDETGASGTLPEIPALVAAIKNQRPDLLPRLLQAGADPNLNGRHGGNAVQWAILRGDVAMLDLLLAHGGQLEKVADSASLLELAVASGSEAMLARLDGNGQADLSAVCIPNGARLQKILFESTDARWHDMLARGLGKRSNRACTGYPPMTVQVLDALLAERDARLVGWRQEQVSRRLGELAERIGKLSEEQGQGLMTQARAAHRDDLVALLEHLGVPRLPEIAPKPPAPPPRSTAADRALGKKLVGHYYLENQREVGSEIILRANGRFDYMLAYGAHDEVASGTWSISKGKLVFRQENAVNPEGWQPYWLVSAEKPAAGAADELVVDVYHENRPVSMLKVVVMGCLAPQTTNGMTFDGRWSGQLAGELCQISLRHPGLNNGEPFIYTLPDALRQAGQRRFVFEARSSAAKASVDIDVSMQVGRGVLIWQRAGREFRYRRQ